MKPNSSEDLKKCIFIWDELIVPRAVKVDLPTQLPKNVETIPEVLVRQ